MSQVWQLFRIQQIDAQLDEFIKKLHELDPGENLLNETEELNKKVEETGEELRKKQAALKDKDLEVQKMVTQKKGFEKKLYSGDSSNPKELHGWQQEIDTLKKTQRVSEDEMLVLMEEIEALEQSMKEQKNTLDAKKREHESAQNNFKQDTETLNQEIETLKSRREKQVETIEKDLWKKYQELSEAKEGVAIGRISKGFCGGCFTNLPENLIKRVQQRNLEFCSNCGRILYADGE